MIHSSQKEFLSVMGRYSEVELGRLEGEHAFFAYLADDNKRAMDFIRGCPPSTRVDWIAPVVPEGYEEEPIEITNWVNTAAFLVHVERVFVPLKDIDPDWVIAFCHTHFLEYEFLLYDVPPVISVSMAL